MVRKVMNSFDSKIISFFNQFSQLSHTFDSMVNFIVSNNLLKAGIVVILFWWYWFKNDEKQLKYREHILPTILSCSFAILLARGMALLLPLRLRPIHESGLSFILPYGVKTDMLGGWSSFPSDHAVMFFALATGLLFVSKKTGIFALIYVTLFISLPRIYLGFHYPTDIIAGAFLGICIGWIGNQEFVIKSIIRPLLVYDKKFPSVFYSLFFLLTSQMLDMFDSSRAIIKAAFKFLESIIR
jgi:undecaprenyl-diphosphatase